MENASRALICLMSCFCVFFPSAVALKVDAEHEIREAALRVHNAKRSQHEKTAPLTWDTALYQMSTSYAEKLVGQSIAHSNGALRGNYGENIFHAQRVTGEVSIENAIEAWYDESRGYDYRNNFPTQGKGHFTQMIWANNLRVGCGRATANLGNKIVTNVVCNYTPGGNVPGLYVANVHVKLASPQALCQEPDMCSSLASLCNLKDFDSIMKQCVKTCGKC